MTNILRKDWIVFDYVSIWHSEFKPRPLKRKRRKNLYVSWNNLLLYQNSTCNGLAEFQANIKFYEFMDWKILSRDSYVGLASWQSQALPVDTPLCFTSILIVLIRLFPANCNAFLCYCYELDLIFERLNVALMYKKFTPLFPTFHLLNSTYANDNFIQFANKREKSLSILCLFIFPCRL